MLLPKATWAGVADGTITVAFRRWKRPTVKAGGTLRSPAGLLAIDAVDRIEPADVTDADARRAGEADREAVLTALAARNEGELYRIRFHHRGDDPRNRLAADAELSAADLENLRRRLDRMDRRDPKGAWTRDVLRLIARNPEVAARLLAPQLGFERDEFKARVRRLRRWG